MKATTFLCCTVFFFAIFASQKAFALVQNCSWIAGPGNWESSVNWSCGFVPNNSATNDFNVSIGDIAMVNGVHLQSGESIFHLAIVVNSTLYFTNGANLFINNFPDAVTGYPEQELAIGGDLVFQNSAGGSANLSLSRGDMTLRGEGGIGGTIHLTNSGSTMDGITGFTNFDTRLIMIEGTAIRGSGQLMDMALVVNSMSQISADNGGTLLWTPATLLFSSTNQGLLQGSGSNSVFALNGYTGAAGYILYNGGGLVSGVNHGAVELRAGFQIIGGDLQSDSTGRVRGGGELQDLTLDTNSQFDVIGRNGWMGTIHNEGIFNVTTNNTIAIDSAAVTLNGGGVVLLEVNTNGAFCAINLLTNTLHNVDNLIHGQGAIENSGGTGVLDNQSRIEADVPGQEFQNYLWLYPMANATWTNSGILRATNGGFLTIGAGGVNFVLTNGNGLIIAHGNSTVRMLDAKIYDGTITADGSGAAVWLDDASELHDLLVTTTNSGLVEAVDQTHASRIAGVLNRGDILVSNGCTLLLTGNITNEGRIILDTNATATTHLSLQTLTVTVSGGGTIELNNANRSSVDGQGASSILINSDNTIHGTGVIQSLLLVNQGTVQADAATPLSIGAPVFGPWTNNGTLRASGAGGLVVSDPLLVNLGTVNINAGSGLSLSSGGGIRQDAGQLIVNGTVSNQFQQPSGGVVINAGTLSGSGVIVGGVTNSGGILTPGSSPGILTVTGKFTQQSAGSLNIEIGGTTPGTSCDQLAIGSAAALGGALKVSFINGFNPSVGDTYPILTCASRTGFFATYSGLSASNGVVLLPRYTATNVALVATTNFQLIHPVETGNAFSFGFQTISGVNYQVQFADTLNPPISWQTLNAPFTGTGLFQLVTNTPLVGPQRFYRVAVQ